MIRFAAAAALAVAPVAAQAPVETPSLVWIHGEWAGAGMMFGRPSEVTISAEPALEGQATAMVYKARVPATEGKPEIRFEGRAIFRTGKGGKVAGRWSDSAGNFHAIGGWSEPRALTTHWGDAATEIGRSTYRLGDDGSLKIADYSLRPDGSWREFASATYRKR